MSRGGKIINLTGPDQEVALKLTTNSVASRKRKGQSTGHKTTSSGGGCKAKEDEKHKRYLRCDVCGRPDPEADNSLVICSGCDVAVHQTCYGVTFIPEGPWHCHRCTLKYDANETKCKICGNSGGAMLPIGNFAFDPADSKKRSWAHALCGLWMPDVIFKRTAPDYTGHLYMVIKNIDPDRYKILKCSVCSDYIKVGACIQCNGGRCRKAVHPYCARSRLKDPYRDEFVEDEAWCLLEMARSDNQFEYHSRCPAHTLVNGCQAPPTGEKPDSYKTSKYRGVWYSVMRYQWLASVQMNGVNIPLGYFDNDEGAALMVDSFVKQQSLDQPLNFPNGCPDIQGTKVEEKKKKSKKRKIQTIDDEYVGHVEAILGKQICLDGIIRYLVKWEGFEDMDNTWEPRENLNCPSLVEDFETKLRTERELRMRREEGVDCLHRWEKNVWAQVPQKEIKVLGKPFVYVRSCVIHSSLILQSMMATQSEEMHPLLKHLSPTAPVNIPGSEESSEKRSGTWEKEGKGGKNPAREEGKREATDLAAKEIYCFGTTNMASRCCCQACGIPYKLLVVCMGIHKGFGVVAGEDIPKGSQVYYKKEGLYYLFEPTHASFIIDATVVGGVARFINHSCKPNCKSKEIVQPEALNLSNQAYSSPPRVVYITTRDVKKGEELTIDYIPNYNEDVVLQKQVKCSCKTPKCRGWVL
ncbi:hypothetical protein AAMO2058_000647500 [Amorphochlora amoebiformis]